MLSRNGDGKNNSNGAGSAMSNRDVVAVKREDSDDKGRIEEQVDELIKEVGRPDSRGLQARSSNHSNQEQGRLGPYRVDKRVLEQKLEEAKKANAAQQKPTPESNRCGEPAAMSSDLPRGRQTAGRSSWHETDVETSRLAHFPKRSNQL
jgi:hypothetical protein